VEAKLISPNKMEDSHIPRYTGTFRLLVPQNQILCNSTLRLFHAGFHLQPWRFIPTAHHVLTEWLSFIFPEFLERMGYVPIFLFTRFWNVVRKDLCWY